MTIPIVSSCRAFALQVRPFGVASVLNDAADEIERLTEALQFYAREYNWQSCTSYMCGHGAINCNAMADKGAKARDAIATEAATAAETVKLGSVHEGVGPTGIAQDIGGPSQ